MDETSNGHISKEMDDDLLTIGVDTESKEYEDALSILRSLETSKSGLTRESFLAACESLGAGTAIKLFLDKRIGFQQLRSSEVLFEQITSPLVPLMSREKLRADIVSFNELQKERRTQIEETGVIWGHVDDLDWLLHRFRRLYDSSTLKLGNRKYEILSHDEFKPLRAGIRTDPKFDLRKELFKGRIEVFDYLADALRKGLFRNLLEKCWERIIMNLSDEHIFLCLRADLQHPAFRQKLFRDAKVEMPGGIADLITLTLHVVKEIMLGTMDETYQAIKEAFVLHFDSWQEEVFAHRSTQLVRNRLQSYVAEGGHLDNPPVFLNSPRTYYDMIRVLKKDDIDYAEKVYMTQRNTERAFWTMYVERLREMCRSFASDRSYSAGGRTPAIEGSRSLLEEYLGWLLDEYSDWSIGYDGVRGKVSAYQLTDDDVNKFDRLTDDYRDVKINGKQFKLTPTQAVVIRVLHKAYDEGRELVEWEEINREIAIAIGESKPKMSYVFQKQEVKRFALYRKIGNAYRLNLF